MDQGICRCTFEHGCCITVVTHLLSQEMGRSEPNWWWICTAEFAAFVKTTVVRPNPVLDRDEGPMLLLLVECNRPLGSPTRPILLTFQEIDSRGPEPERTWRAYLAPPTINLQYLADRCACEPFHILAPLGTEDRRWIGRDQSRPVVSGRYIPIWFDLRRPPFSSIEPVDGAGTVVTDESSFMQRGGGRECSRSPRRAEDTTPFSTQSSSNPLLAHVFRLSREHRVLTLDRPSSQTLSEQVRRHWAAPERHGFTNLHIVSWPPADLESTGDETYIVEFAVDRQRQADPADKLIIVDVKIQQDNPTVAGSHLRRVLWSRGFMMREDMLHLLSSAGLCKLSTIHCTLKVNYNPWPPEDGARRQMMHGDFVQLDVLGPERVPSSHIQVALCEQEAADSQRFLYHASPSPSPEPTTPFEEAEGSRADGSTPVEDEHSDRTSRTRRRRREDESDENVERSASVSLLQHHASYKPAHGRISSVHGLQLRPPFVDLTNLTTNTDNDNRHGVILQDVTNVIRAQTPKISVDPHVTDLWCGSRRSFDASTHDTADYCEVSDCTVRAPRVLLLDELLPSSDTALPVVLWHIPFDLTFPSVVLMHPQPTVEEVCKELACWGFDELVLRLPQEARADFLIVSPRYLQECLRQLFRIFGSDSTVFYGLPDHLPGVAGLTSHAILGDLWAANTCHHCNSMALWQHLSGAFPPRWIWQTLGSHHQGLIASLSRSTANTGCCHVERTTYLVFRKSWLLRGSAPLWLSWIGLHFRNREGHTYDPSWGSTDFGWLKTIHRECYKSLWHPAGRQAADLCGWIIWPQAQASSPWICRALWT